MRDKYIITGSIAFIVIFLIILGCGGSGADFVLPRASVEEPPPTPVNGHIINIFTQTAEISWTQPLQSEQKEFNLKYKIYINDNLYKTLTKDDFSYAAQGTDEIKINYTLKELNKNTTYKISIFSVTQNGTQSNNNLHIKFNTMNQSEPPKKPDSPEFISSSLTQAQINFKSNPNTAKYKLLINDSPYSLSEDTDEIFYFFKGGTYEIINLEGSTEYEIGVIAINGYGTSEISSLISFSTGSAPDVPEDIVISNISDSSFRITWQSVTEASEYIIEYTNLGQNIQESFSTTSNMAVISNLNPGTSYEVGLRARNTFGTSSLSEINTILTRNVPAIPENITTLEVTVSSFEFGWDDVETADSYRVYVDNSFYSSSLNNDFILSNLSQEETYKINLKAVNDYGDSDLSDDFIICTANVEEVPPDLPEDDVVTIEQHPESLQVEWNDFPYASQYRIEYNKTGSPSSNTTLISTFPTILIQDLETDTSYDITIEGINSVGVSPALEVTASTTDIPDSVTNLKLDTRSRNFFQISWNKPAGTQNYRILCEHNTHGEILEQITEETVLAVNEEDTTPNLEPGQTYTITVFSRFDGNENPDISDENQIQVETSDTPPAPVNLNITDITKNSFVLDWEEITDIAYYNVFLNQNNTETTFNTIENTLQLSELSMDTRYTVEVSAVNNDNLESDRSEKEALRTNPPVPAEPSGLKVVDLGNNFVRIGWNSVQYALDYVIEATGHTPEEIETTSTSLELDSWNTTPVINEEIKVSARNRIDESGNPSKIYAAGLNSPGFDEDETTPFVNKIYLKWDSVERADYYLLTVDDKFNRKKISNTYYTLTGLEPGTEYTIKVKASNNLDESQYSANLAPEFSTTYDEPASFEITGYFKDINDNPQYGTDEITILWEIYPEGNNIYTDTFEIYAKLKDEGNFGEPVEIITGFPDDTDEIKTTLNSWCEEGFSPKPMQPDREYEFKIIAQNPHTSKEDENSQNHDFFSLKTDYIPLPPSNFEVVETATSFHLSWKNEESLTSRPAKWEIDWDEDNIELDSNTTYKEVVPPEPRLEHYTLKIIAHNETETASAESSSITASLGDLPTVSIRNFENIFANKFKVYWDGENADFYNLYIDGSLVEENMVETYYDFSGLDPATAYDIKVTAHNQYTEPDGDSAPSENIETINTKNKIDYIGESALLNVDPMNPDRGVFASSISGGKVIISAGGNVYISEIAGNVPSMVGSGNDLDTDYIAGVDLHGIDDFIFAVDSGLNRTKVYDINGNNDFVNPADGFSGNTYDTSFYPEDRGYLFSLTNDGTEVIRHRINAAEDDWDPAEPYINIDAGIDSSYITFFETNSGSKFVGLSDSN
ncbi:MAG: fibronectin type III domain-containing protein, partial [Candidatus Muiribacteriota bacterium]